jgi:hypothetical protein
MRTLIRLELMRVARDRRFWFWSLVGVPVLLPALVVLLAFAMASTGTVEPTVVRATVATTVDDAAFLSALESRGLPAETLHSRAQVIAAITAGEYSAGLVDVALDPGQPLKATLLAAGDGRQLPVYQQLEASLHDIARERRTALIDELSFDGPSFELLMEPITIAEERVPDRLPSGLVQVVTLLWFAMLLFPYLLLTWNGGSRAVTDRMSGYLAALNASAMAPWKWLTVRWLTLSTIATALLLYSAVLFGVYMAAFGTVADMLVAEGVLEGLSEGAAIKAQAYLVDGVRIWRETSFLSFVLWLVVAALQLSAACALVLWGSVTAGSLAQYRLFELIPFAVVFLFPLMGLGALGTGLNVSAWVPGLNTVLSAQHAVTGGLPGVEFFAATGIAVLVSGLVVITCLLLGNLSMRNERLWAG